MHSILGTVRYLAKRVESLENKLSVQDVEMKEQSSLPTKPPPSSASIVDNWVTVVSRKTHNQNNEPLPKLSSNQSEILNSIFVEKDERERRKNKLLIFGVNKSSEDSNEATKQVKSI